MTKETRHFRIDLTFFIKMDSEVPLDAFGIQSFTQPYFVEMLCRILQNPECVKHEIQVSEKGCDITTKILDRRPRGVEFIDPSQLQLGGES